MFRLIILVFLVMLTGCNSINNISNSTNKLTKLENGSDISSNANKDSNWKEYIDNQFSYSVNVPSDWIEDQNIGNSGEKYFYNEDIDSNPMLMSKNGIFLTIEFQPDMSNYQKILTSDINSEFIENNFKYTKLDESSMQSRRVINYSRETIYGAPIEASYELIYDFPVNSNNSNSGIYQMKFLFGGFKSGADSNFDVAKKIASTFKFVNQK